MYEYLHIYISSLYRALYMTYLEEYNKITAISPKFIVSPGQRSRDDRCQPLFKLMFQLMCPKRNTLGVDGKKEKKKKKQAFLPLHLLNAHLKFCRQNVNSYQVTNQRMEPIGFIFPQRKTMKPRSLVL